MQHFVRTSSEQRPGQWAVRCTGLLCYLLLIASVPVLHLGWMLVRGPGTHAIRTRSQVEAPALEWKDVEDGTWMKRLERHLQEESPVVWEMRGSYNEARYCLGLLQNDQVHIGREGWMFLRGFLDIDGVAVARATTARRQKLQRLRERAERLGVAIIALPLPDKARVYAEYAFSGGTVPPALQPVYGSVLADLAAAGIPAVDAGSVLQAARAANPAQMLFHRGDGHWTLPGCIAVAQALTAYLEQGQLAERLGPKVPLALRAPMRIDVIPDLVALLGLRCWVAPGPHEGGIMRPASLVSSRLTETKEYWAAGKEGVGGYEPTVAVAGSSFSVENGYEAYGWFLGRLVDHQAVWPGSLPWESIERALARVERGESKARVLVWEFLERAYGHPSWTSQ